MSASNTCSPSAVVKQVAEYFPILIVSKGDCTLLINSQELIVTGDGFEALVLVDQVPKSSHKKPSEKETIFFSTASGTHSQIGRPSLLSQFPSIVSTAASFVKANGFSAHEQRRESIGKVGVSLREIRDHVLSSVPGLKNMELVQAQWLISCSPQDMEREQTQGTKG